ncbi:uncharacterized protein LOC118413651 [Branchiostoma floridae]|uniref:Uncharacterized protein LOC118413651 n=1 Tax=Branchiostoma floridae TaxID=7739 RepID=A0A9J7KYZ0_BRAFL|nr:uncharacterized protein LOC118413651 [Branchiostoma floridae]
MNSNSNAKYQYVYNVFLYVLDCSINIAFYVVYGWAKSCDDVVSHYGYYRDDLGLKGHCYIDGFCGDGTVVATMTSSVTKEVKEMKTGNQPNYPHVGLGWTGQQITWGYDLNTSPHGHRGNWYTSSCCLTETPPTSGMLGATGATPSSSVRGRKCEDNIS